jgi:hypothetical protein
MATGPRAGGRAEEAAEGVGRVSREVASESKPFFLTSEFWALAIAVLAILVAGAISGDEVEDTLNANRVWFYVTILTAAYILSRGVARAGARREQTGLEDRGRGRSLRGRYGGREPASAETPARESGSMPATTETGRRTEGRGPGL